MPKARIAARLGVSRARITQLAKQEDNVTLKTVKEFCRACDLNLTWSVSKTHTRRPSADIPEKLKPLFWDTDPSELDPVMHRNYLLERILTRGNEEAVRWMNERFTKRQIVGFVGRHKRRLDARSLNYWAFIYGKEDKWAIPSAPASNVSWQKLQDARP